MLGRTVRSIYVWETLRLDVCNLTYIPHTKATDVIEFSPNARSWHYCTIFNGSWINFIVNLHFAKWRQRLFICYKPMLSITFLQFKQKILEEREQKILTKFGQRVQPRHWPTIYPKGDSLRLQWEQQIHRQPTEKKRAIMISVRSFIFHAKGWYFTAVIMQ